MDERGVVRTYLAIGAVTTLAQSLIWGVNTLFLLDAGLDIFGVMVANAAFAAGQVLFEVPTGVIADTLGRRASYLVSTAIVLASTLLYVTFGFLHAGVVPFILASVLLGLGFTFYTGAVDAWMVDALDHVGYHGRVDVIFARSGVAQGAAMLLGTIGGGLLGQIDLSVPYIARAALLVPAFLLGVLAMRDLGFTARRLRLASFGAETRRIAHAGVTYGLRNAVVRPLMLASLVQGLFFMYGFYSWQRYFLDLLGRDLIWVNGVIAALVGGSQIAGNLLVGRLTRRSFTRSSVILTMIAAQCVAVVGAALLPSFWVAVPLYLISTLAFGVMQPIKQAWLNARIPSAQRATLISLDALFMDAGGSAGQVGLGYLSRAASIPLAWVVGGGLQLLGLPLVWRARRAARQRPAGAADSGATLDDKPAAPESATP